VNGSAATFVIAPFKKNFIIQGSPTDWEGRAAAGSGKTDQTVPKAAYCAPSGILPNAFSTRRAELASHGRSRK